MLNHSLDIVGPVGGPGLQRPLGCGQWELQPSGLVGILRRGEEGDQSISPGAAHQHSHKVQRLAGEARRTHNFCRWTRPLQYEALRNEGPQTARKVTSRLNVKGMGSELALGAWGLPLGPGGRGPGSRNAELDSAPSPGSQGSRLCLPAWEGSEGEQKQKSSTRCLAIWGRPQVPRTHSLAKLLC